MTLTNLLDKQSVEYILVPVLFLLVDIILRDKVKINNSQYIKVDINSIQITNENIYLFSLSAVCD